MASESAGTENASPGSCDWAEVTDTDWKPEFTTGRDGLSLTFTGSCPRCQHKIFFTVPYARYGVLGTTERAAPEGFTMYCECGYPHQGHPEGDNSCGAYWPYEAEL